MKFVLDAHTHTIASGHAYSTLLENVNYAAEKGLELVGITDHAPAMEGSFGSAYFINFGVIPREINGVKVRMGVELNIIDYDGNVDLPDFYLERMDYAIASLHPPCIPFGTLDENMNAIFKVMENKYIKILGHPGDPRYPIDCEALVKKSAETGTLIEINNASLVPNGFRGGSEKYIFDILKLCKKMEVPVIAASDAHFCTHIGDFTYVEKMFEQAEFPEELVVNRSVEEFEKYITK